MAEMTNEEKEIALYTLGPWLIGAFGDILFQGVLVCQFSHYVEWHWEDKLSIRLQVLALAIISTLKSVHCFAGIWIMFVLHFTDISGAAGSGYTAWWYKGNSLMVATIGAFVQAYFCRRLFAVSKRNWFVLVPIAAVFVFSYVSVCIMTHYVDTGSKPNAVFPGALVGTWNASHLGSVFAGDLLLTLSMVYFLIKAKKDVLPQTVGILSSLLRLTIQSAAPASLCAMINLILVIIQTQSGNSNMLMSSCPNLILPKLYAFSMMWTLNARHSIRNASSGGRHTSFEGSSGRRRDNVELKTYGGPNNAIQVHTHVETAQQIDVHFDDHVHEARTQRDDDFKVTSSV